MGARRHSFLSRGKVTLARGILDAATWLEGGGGAGEVRTVLRQGVRLQAGRTTAAEFQGCLDRFFANLELEQLLAAVDFSRVRMVLCGPDGYKRTVSSWRGRHSLSLALRLSHHLGIAFDFLILRRTEQIPPHGHRRVVSGFYLVEGRVGLRQYHVERDLGAESLLRLSVDRVMAPREFGTESDVRDNIHWLCGLADQSILFRVNLKGVPGPGPAVERRYVDPRGEPDSDGLIQARWTDEASARVIPPFAT
jgi:hypothetical protein